MSILSKVISLVTGGTFKLYAGLTLAGMIVVSVGGLYWYTNSLEKSVMTLTENNIKLSGVVVAQEGVISSIQRDISQGQALQRDLREVVRKNNDDYRTLADKFTKDAAGRPRDFGAIAARSPGLIAKIVNNGSTNATRCLELASGAPPNAKEKEHLANGISNSTCPALLPPPATQK